MCWCNPEYSARWRELEGGIATEFPKQAAIGDKGHFCVRGQ